MISSKENPKISYGTAIISRIDWKIEVVPLMSNCLKNFKEKGMATKH